MRAYRAHESKGLTQWPWLLFLDVVYRDGALWAAGADLHEVLSPPKRALQVGDMAALESAPTWAATMYSI